MYPLKTMCVKFSNYKEDFGLKKWYKSQFCFFFKSNWDLGVYGDLDYRHKRTGITATSTSGFLNKPINIQVCLRVKGCT